MTKKVSIILLAIVAIMLLLIMCGRGNREGVSQPEQAAAESLRLNIIQTKKTDSLISVKNSQISAFEKKDSISRVQIASISKEYNRLRSIVRHLTSVRVDSLGQQVDNIPVDEYNALIEQGNECDSMIAIQDQRLAGKDSINHYQNQIIQEQTKENQTTNQALCDFIKLAEEEKSGKEKAKKLNKKIPLLLAIDAVIVFVVSVVILK